MTPLTRGFCGELEKLAGALSFLAKHPLMGANIAFTGAAAIPAAYAGAREGMSGNASRVLRASKFGPSEAFYSNFHDVLPHQLTPAQERHLSLRYRPEAFKRS